MSTRQPRHVSPTVLLCLDPELRGLAAAHVLALSRRSPAAARLAASVDLAGRFGEAPRLFRRAAERVTDLSARTLVHQAGLEIRDELLVPVAWTLGGSGPDGGELRALLETLLATVGSFYRGTRVELHAFVFLPDLHVERGARYARAYEQLAALESAVGPGAPRLQGEPLFAHRWLCDCRTHSGAHAGTVAEVFAPVAEFLSVLGLTPAARRVDVAYRPVLFGAAEERLTGYSAPGYAEIVFRPRQLLRQVACRAGAVYAQAASRAARPGDRAAIEDAAAGMIAAIRPTGVAGALLPPPADPGADPVYEVRRERQRGALVTAAARTALQQVRAAGDRLGFGAASLVVDAAVAPMSDSAAGPLRPRLTLADLDRETRSALRTILGVDALKSTAASLRAGASPETVPAAGGAGPDAATEGGSAAAQPAPAVDSVAEAARLEAEAAALEALLLPGGDLDRLERELVRALGPAGFFTPPEGGDDDVPADEAGAWPEGAPGAAEAHVEEGVAGPAAAMRVRRRRRRSAEEVDAVEARVASEILLAPRRPRWDPRSWLGHLRSLWQGEAAAAPDAPPTPDPRSAGSRSAVAGGGGGPAPVLLVEWLRWLRDFRDHLTGTVAPVVAAFRADLQRVAEAYELEAKRLQRHLSRDDRFSHKLLTAQRCDEIFRQAQPAIDTHMSASGRIPLSSYLREDEPLLRAGEHPLNHRFEGLDPALSEAASTVLAEWLERSVEDLLLDDPAVTAHSLPRYRLRALADAARPLVRPEDLALQPAQTSVLLLGLNPEESRLPGVFSKLEPAAHYAGEGDASRISLRTALHGFPAFALRQLQPVRDAYATAASSAGLALDPLPMSSMVQADHEELLSLAVAFGLLQVAGNGLATPWFADPVDEIALSRFFAQTFAGQTAFAEFRETVGEEFAGLMREEGGDAAETLRSLAEALPEPHAARVERVAGAIDRGGWPASVPFGEVERA